MILITILLLLTPVFIYYYHLKTGGQLNLIIISIDTLRPDHMGIYGYNKDTTPNIDKWAKGAFVFTNARTATPVTYPSFASLMTGLSPFSTKIVANKRDVLISKDKDNLVKILKGNGYYSSAFITTEVLSLLFTNVNEEFNEYYYLNNPFKDFNKVENYNEYYQEYEKMINKAVDWLGINRNKKFLFWVHLMNPHAPYLPPDDLKCKFNKNYCDTIFSKTNTELSSRELRFTNCQENLSENDLETYKTLYDGEVASSDKLVKKFFDKLKETGLDKKSIVVLYGDHGEGFDHNFYFAHPHVLYDSTTRIPLIIKHPLISSGDKIIKPIENTDVLPTILDLLNIPSKDLRIDGKSFSNVFYYSFISDLVTPEKDFIYAINDQKSKFSVYDGKYKYIYSQKNSCLYKNQQEELYDIKNDPNEEKNLASDKKDIVDQLKNNLFNYLNINHLLDQTDSNKKPQENIDKLRGLGY